MSKSNPQTTYTVQEIDRMRRLLPEIMFPTIWYSRTSGMGSGGSYKETDRKTEIEERLRTYLLAGIRPEQLEEEARRRLSFPEKQHA